MLKFLYRLIAVAAGIAVLSLAVVWGLSEWKLRRVYEAPLVSLQRTAAPDLDEGKRMARIVGCWAGCHGMEGQGGSDDMAGYYSVTAPTLSAVLPGYSDEELVRLIRYGVKRDGRSAVGMSSYTFFALADADLVNIIAHLRHQPARPPVERHRQIGFGGRLKLLRGEWQPSADEVDRSLPRWGELPRNTSFERGRYLASVTCTECHGLRFSGNAFEGGPSLAIVASYGLQAFQRLVHTGVPLSGRDLGVMSWTARNGFAYFTDDEVADIYTFLRTYHGVEPWLGQWNGPEGTYLKITGGADAVYGVAIRDLDRERTYRGEGIAEGIEFERDGVKQRLRATDGAATGMKWLSEKKNCLTVRSGEGYCRE